MSSMRDLLVAALYATMCCWNGVESFSVNSMVMSSTTMTKSSSKDGARLEVVPSAPQLLQFKEPQTNVTVVLVGAMHYNPSSVNLADRTIQSLGDRDMLGSVVVESCDIRWNKTKELYDEKPFLKKLLNNEMRTACDVAVSYGRPVVLGDQQINITTDEMKSTLKQTFVDLVSPPAGWRRFFTELSRAWDETLPFGGPGYLNALSFFDPRLWLVLPISLVKYPLSFLVRDPLPTSIVLSSLFALSYFDDPYTMEELISNQVPMSDYVLSFVISVLETIVFARILLKPMLADRNIFLAESILDQCKIYASPSSVSDKTKDSSGWFDFFTKPKTSTNRQKLETSSFVNDAVYAPESPSEVVPDGENKVVVAVLGMAHCNGIMKLLKEQRV